MPANIRQILRELKKGFQSVYGAKFKGMYLFGSYARGDYVEGSDLDVLVILTDFERAPLEINRTGDLVGDICLEHLITVSPVFIREKDWLSADRPLLRNVREEGVAV